MHEKRSQKYEVRGCFLQPCVFPLLGIKSLFSARILNGFHCCTFCMRLPLFRRESEKPSWNGGGFEVIRKQGRIFQMLFPLLAVCSFPWMHKRGRGKFTSLGNIFPLLHSLYIFPSKSGAKGTMLIFIIFCNFCSFSKVQRFCVRYFHASFFSHAFSSCHDFCTHANL